MKIDEISAHQLLSEAQALFPYTQELRRDFHRPPELGFKEKRTAGIVARELRSLDLEVRTEIAETGVVGLIEGTLPGPVVMLRFDMDALPIQEETGAFYQSQVPGCMHACGHDGHIAIGLTVARLLKARRSSLQGTVMLVFQPAEEGLGGAERMIADGVLNGPRPDVAFGFHLWNEKPLGWIGATPGPAMAAGDIFKIAVTGRGGHGAQPHLAADPVLASSQVVSLLQSIVARNLSPLESGVLSVTMIHGGEAFNIIPARVEMAGTIRTFDERVRERVIRRLEEILHGTVEALGCKAELEITALTPAVVNDPQSVLRVQSLARQLFPEYTIQGDFQVVVSEDMAHFLNRVPGCFVFIGSADAEKGLDAHHHHPKFDFDEKALPVASALAAAAALSCLTQPGS